jgi:hypothetical protein
VAYGSNSRCRNIPVGFLTRFKSSPWHVSGPDAGGYYHPLFLRGMSSLAENIPRISIKGKGPRKTVPENAPNFYDLPHLPDVKAPTLTSSIAESGSPNFSLARREVADDMSLQMQISRLQSELGTSIIPSSLLPLNILPPRTLLNGASGQNLVNAVLTESVLRADKARFQEQVKQHHRATAQRVGVPDFDLDYGEALLAAVRRRRQVAILSSPLSLLAMYNQYPTLVVGGVFADSMDFVDRNNGYP